MNTKDHQRIDKSYGNGYSEPREHYIECSCGALIWAWQQFYEENPTDPDEAFIDHLAMQGGSR